MTIELAPDQTYGHALPDQVERIASLFDAHLELIGDVRDLYASRATIEREYAAKLQTLAKKAIEKKVKMETRFILGDDPTKSWDPSVLQRNTLNGAYEALINSISDTIQDHLNIADALSAQVVEVLRILEKKNDDAKKKEMQFFQKLLADRDRVYTDRLKSKQKYDEECEETESFRQKQSRTQDDKHKKHAAKQAEQQRNDMLNSKNTYLISTAIANSVKDKFYVNDLPCVENEFQRLQRYLVERFVKILLQGQGLQLNHLDKLKSRSMSVQEKLAQVQPLNDQVIFIEHNTRHFAAPGNWKFDPCAVHYDTDQMSVEPAPKIFLQNKLSRCRSKLQELQPLITAKQSEFERLSRQLDGFTKEYARDDVDDFMESYLEAEHQLISYNNSRCILEAEISTITAAIGDDEGARNPHTFKSSTFSIPTQCGYCEASIWGLSKQGKTCKLCGLSVHTKCELKVPADCPANGSPFGNVLGRKTTLSSMSRSSSNMQRIVTPTPSSFVQFQTSEEPEEETYPTAKILYDFTPSSEFELGVQEGAVVRVVEPDDGSGWVKVADSRGNSGLVPASYIGTDGSDSVDPESVSIRQGSGQQVRAIYSYKSQGSDELGLREGEILELTVGGESFGNGWWEGFNASGQKGIFPSSYVERI